jgi:hypothetical protein
MFAGIRKAICKQCAVRKVAEIAHLPIWQRIFHKNARRTVLAYLGGCATILIGVAIAKYSEHFHDNYLLHISVDALGYCIHGVGFVPFVRYAEAAWTLVMGVAVVEAVKVVHDEVSI